MKINTAHLILKTDKKVTEDINRVRGYFGNTFREYPLLHNHYSNERLLYSYPLIQYKVLDGEVSILGIEEGIKTLKEISSEINELKLSDKYYRVTEKIMFEKEINITPTREEHHYKFLIPWLALNSKNYQKYIVMKDWKDKKLFLNNILIGNILSMAKGLGIIVNREIYPKTILDAVSLKYKSIAMTGFNGEFKIKFRIPDFFSLGKGASQGFGTVKEIIDEDEEKKE
ncbi:MAG: hypothetical protein LBT66_00640 [Methanobrevibacter sp.]|jgi:hypothetical protein|nr:hypothetical protein [Candidatus Methanovirga meridionalis]